MVTVARSVDDDYTPAAQGAVLEERLLEKLRQQWGELAVTDHET